MYSVVCRKRAEDEEQNSTHVRRVTSLYRHLFVFFHHNHIVSYKLKLTKLLFLPLGTKNSWEII